MKIHYKSFCVLFIFALSFNFMNIVAHKPKTYTYTEQAGKFDALIKEVRSAGKDQRDTIYEKIESFLDQGGDVNRVDLQGRTLLLAAAENGHFDDPLFMDLLLTRGANPNIALANGLSPIIVLAVRDAAYISVTKRLARLLQQPNVDLAMQFGGKTPLDFARLKNNTPVITLLEKYKQEHPAHAKVPPMTIEEMLKKIDSALMNKEPLTQRQCFAFAERAAFLDNVSVIQKLVESKLCQPDSLLKNNVFVPLLASNNSQNVFRYLIQKIDKVRQAEILSDMLENVVSNITNMPSTNVQYHPRLSMLATLLDYGADPKLLKDFIDPESENYNKDIATYYKEFVRNAESYRSLPVVQKS